MSNTPVKYEVVIKQYLRSIQYMSVFLSTLPDPFLASFPSLS